MLSFVRKGRLLFRRPYISVPFRTPDNDLIRYKPAVVEVIDEDDEEIIDELLPSGERDPRRIVAKKLLSLGKVMYKHIEPLPEWFLSKRSTLCAYRTPSQVRRCLKDWMIYVDRETNSKFRDKVVGWKIGPLNPERANDLRAYGPEEAIAYAHYFMPPRFSIARKVFVEVRTVLPNFKPSRVIDFGCGPGTAGAAVHDVWEGAMAKYVGVDMSRAMLDSAKIMLEGLGSVDAVFWDKTADVVKRARERGERYDLAIISYTLSELTSDHARRAATQIMYELLDVGGVLVIIEQGNPVGSFICRSARKLILENFNEGAVNLRLAKQLRRLPGTPFITKKKSKLSSGAEEDPLNPPIELILPAPANRQYTDMRAAVIAPCSHDKPCPLAPGSFCSFSQKVLSGVIRKDAEEKYSYVAMQKTAPMELQSRKDGRNAELPQDDKWLVHSDMVPMNIENPTPLAVLKRALASSKKHQMEGLVESLLDEVDWEEYNPPLHRNEWSRIVRTPIKANGHVTMDVCSPEGQMVRHVLSKGNVKAIPALYVALRKTTWGGLFPYLPDRIQVSPFSLAGASRVHAVPIADQSPVPREKTFGEVPDANYLKNKEAYFAAMNQVGTTFTQPGGPDLSGLMQRLGPVRREVRAVRAEAKEASKTSGGSSDVDVAAGAAAVTTASTGRKRGNRLRSISELRRKSREENASSHEDDA